MQLIIDIDDTIAQNVLDTFASNTGYSTLDNITKDVWLTQKMLAWVRINSIPRVTIQNDIRPIDVVVATPINGNPIKLQ